MDLRDHLQFGTAVPERAHHPEHLAMSDSTADRSTTATPAASPLKRRGLLIGAGAAGAAVLAAKALPGAAPAAAPLAVAAKKVVDTQGGYQITDHVLRYYETTRS